MEHRRFENDFEIKHFWTYVVSFVLGFVISVGTFWIQKPALLFSSSDLYKEGDVVAAGWPIQYVRDNFGSSVMGVIGPEDHWNIFHFVYNTVFWCVALLLVLLFMNGIFRVFNLKK